MKKHSNKTDFFGEKRDCCNNPLISFENGYAVCHNCGEVVDKLFSNQERRAYNNEEKENRVCSEPTWREFGPRTDLSKYNKDYKGSGFNSKKRELFSRLSKIHRSLISGLERNLWEAKPKLKYLSTRLCVPQYVNDMAWKIYTTVAKEKLTIGRSIEGFIAASLYAAIRIHEFPKLLDDISEVSLVSRHTIIRSLGFIVREILPKMHLKYSPITVEQLIFYFGNKLELPTSIQLNAHELYSRACQNGLNLNGKDPKGFAASLLYLAAIKSEYKKTQSEVALAAKTNEVTLRSRIKDLKKCSEFQDIPFSNSGTLVAN
ncbi:MAG: transcription initiation factor IIB family protein [Promethearchaeota archaeon]